MAQTLLRARLAHRASHDCNTLLIEPLFGRGQPVTSVRERNVSANNPQRTRNTAQIEADLAATRDRLTASVQALIDQVHPNRIKQRQIDNVKRLANAELDNAKSLIFNARGDLRTDRVAALAGAAAGLVTFLIIIRKIVRRGRRGRLPGA
jgi:hypothetical protein